MKYIKYITGLFYGVLFFFPLKIFWKNYFNIYSMLCDFIFVLLAIPFFIVYNFLFEQCRKNKK